MELYNDTQSEILLALARFKFLTTSQINVLVPKENAWLRKQILDLYTRSKPMLDRVSFGFHPKKGKLENVYYMTRYGQKLLCEVFNMNEEEIKMPVGTGSLFYKDYFHRKNTIDCQIGLHGAMGNTLFEVEFFDTYFDKVGNNRRDGNLHAKNKIDLTGDGYIIPDGVFVLRMQEFRFLYLLEMYDGRDTKRVMEQIRKHAEAIGLGTPSRKYGLQKSHRVLCVFEFESNKNAVLERMQADKALAELTNHFLLKTLGSVQPHNFRDRWQNIQGELVSLV